MASRGKFKPGQSGNPSGRPKGARNATTLAAEALLDGEAEQLTRKAIELALEGDIQALRICMDRIVPHRKGRPVTFQLPGISNSGDLSNVAMALLRSVAEGDVTPEEAVPASTIIEAARRAIETTELIERLDALEGKRTGRGPNAAA